MFILNKAWWEIVGKFVDKYLRRGITTILLGEYRHNLDSKKRLTIPSKLRLELGEKPVLTKGLDNCLFVYPFRDWELLLEKLSKLPLSSARARNFKRFILSGAQDADIDQAGRVLIPDHLKKYAELGKTVVIIGVGDRIELWNEKEWEKYLAKIEKESGDITEGLGEYGI